MNAPDRYERFVVPEDEQRIQFKKDLKLPSAGTFVLQREDHTVGNLGKLAHRQLHRDKEVTFAGYKVPHPLEYRMLIKVQTRGNKEPVAVVGQAFEDLAEEFEDIKQQFEEEERLKAQLTEPGPAFYAA